MFWLPTWGQTTKFWPPDLSPSIIRLFEEYLRRSEELRVARRRESFWLFALILSGVLALVSPWLSLIPGFSFFCLALAYFVFRRYLRVREQVNHALINLNVLHHHLQGKLEVGFCRHETSCNCVNEFRRFVWQKYHIALDGELEVG